MKEIEFIKKRQSLWLKIIGTYHYAIIMVDILVRRRAISMGLNVIGTLRILRLMYDAKLIGKSPE